MGSTLVPVQSALSFHALHTNLPPPPPYPSSRPPFLLHLIAGKELFNLFVRWPPRDDWRLPVDSLETWWVFVLFIYFFSVRNDRRPISVCSTLCKPSTSAPQTCSRAGRSGISFWLQMGSYNSSLRRWIWSLLKFEFLLYWQSAHCPPLTVPTSLYLLPSLCCIDK